MIEDGIPMPTPRPRRGTVSGTIAAMEPGQSILVPRHRVEYVRALVCKHKDRHYTLRKTEDGHRCWRVS